MTSGLASEQPNGIQVNRNLLPPSLTVVRSRSKRDLIGFNRQTNNIFSHKRNWNNRPIGMFLKLFKVIASRIPYMYLGNDFQTMLQTVADEEEQAVRSLMLEQKRQKEQAILNRISYLKQHCTCYLFCTGNKRRPKISGLIQFVKQNKFLIKTIFSGSHEACKELMRLETKVSNGLNWPTLKCM